MAHQRLLRTTLMLVSLVGFVGCTVSQRGPNQARNPHERDAIVAINRAGGQVRDTHYVFGGTSTAVTFFGSPVSDQDLQTVGPQLAYVGGLDQLDLSKAAITDAGLQYLDRAGVRSLNLSRTRIDGSGFGDMTSSNRVAYLNLSGSSVKDGNLRNLSAWTNLRQVDLSHTGITGQGFADWSHNSQITSLNLANSAATDEGLAALSDLQHLYDLSLANTQITGRLFARRPQHVVHLNLTNTRVTDATLPGLRIWSKLEHLDLSNTKVNGSGLRELASSSIRTLDLSGTNIDDNGLANLKGWRSVSSLNLRNSRVTDAGLVQLYELQSLQSINLTGTTVTSAGATALVRKHPKCKVVGVPVAPQQREPQPKLVHTSAERQVQKPQLPPPPNQVARVQRSPEQERLEREIIELERKLQPGIDQTTGRPARPLTDQEIADQRKAIADVVQRLEALKSARR